MNLTFLCVNMAINIKNNNKLYSRLEVVNAIKSRFVSEWRVPVFNGMIRRGGPRGATLERSEKSRRE